MTTDFLEYLMEDPQEIERLERKTDPDVVLAQAQWAGISAGMRVADIGCGPGLTSSILLDAVQPGGQVVGVDFSAERIQHARNRYQRDGLLFQQEDFFGDLTALGDFDFVWARFVLEFHRSRAT
ncbi:MAG: class I SAM-dependent methyltransferase, partial [Desulfuromonadales bacterium]|nr:class I SAM-dependent methyltransferase [Desulfuromonadales bacterium]